MTIPWYLTEAGHKAHLAEALARVDREHESFAKRLFWGALAAFLGAAVLAIHLWRTLRQTRRKRG